MSHGNKMDTLELVTNLSKRKVNLPFLQANKYKCTIAKISNRPLTYFFLDLENELKQDKLVIAIGCFVVVFLIVVVVKYHSINALLRQAQVLPGQVR